MGRDSSDYMTCDKCELYEIDQCGQCSGVESGIMNCSKHIFCIQCYPEAFKNIKLTFTDIGYIKEYGRRYFEEEGITDESTDEEILEKFDISALEEAYAEKGVPKELCPMCEVEKAEKRKAEKRKIVKNKNNEILKYLLKKVGMTKQQVLKEMKKI